MDKNSLTDIIRLSIPPCSYNVLRFKTILVQYLRYELMKIFILYRNRNYSTFSGNFVSYSLKSPSDFIAVVTIRTFPLHFGNVLPVKINYERYRMSSPLPIGTTRRFLRNTIYRQCRKWSGCYDCAFPTRRF